MDIVLRATVIFIVVLVLTRAVGKRELSSLEPFDIILLVVIGDLVQQGVTQSDYSLTGAVLAILTITVLTAASKSSRWPTASAPAPLARSTAAPCCPTTCPGSPARSGSSAPSPPMS